MKVKTARGEIKDDPAFRPTEIYHREATAHVDGKDLPEMGEVLVTYQGYRENTVCYSPITKSIDLATFFINDEVLVSYQGCGERTNFAIRRSRSLSDLATQRDASWTTGRLFSTMR